MQKVAIVTDSIACLPQEIVAQYGIRIVPLNFYSEGKVYKEWVDITTAEAYGLFLKDPKSFKTSAASPEDYFEAYREASQQAKNILCVTISAKLSAVYSVAQGAKERARTELPQTSIEVLDSWTATAAEGFIALAAARAAAEGKGSAEVIKVAEEVRDRVSIVAFMDTVRYVYRTGRIHRVAAWAGSMLNIRPVFTISSGVPRFIGAVRNRERGIDRLLKVMRGRVGSNPAHVAVVHAYALDEAEKLKERVASEFNCAELWITEFSPVMGYACGTGTLGLVFYSDD
ncbi:DegV family protein [Chloroflexota bacterium]